MCEQRRIQARPQPKLSQGWLKFQMLTMLSCRWSPQQMARTLKGMYPEHDQARQRVSHETIYRTLYAHAGGELRRELLACLRWQRSKPRSCVFRRT
jgi:IS30 family transposase